MFRNLRWLSIPFFLIFLFISSCVVDPGFFNTNQDQTSKKSSDECPPFEFTYNLKAPMGEIVYSNTNWLTNSENSLTKASLPDFWAFDSKINTMFYFKQPPNIPASLIKLEEPIYARVNSNNNGYGPVEVFGFGMSGVINKFNTCDMLAGDNDVKLLIKEYGNSFNFICGEFHIDSNLKRYFVYNVVQAEFSTSLEGMISDVINGVVINDVAYGNDEPYFVGNIYVLAINNVFYIDVWSFAMGWKFVNITKNLRTFDLDSDSRLDATKSVVFVSGKQYFYGSMYFNGFPSGASTHWYTAEYIDGPGININKKSIKAKRRDDGVYRDTEIARINMFCHGSKVFPFPLSDTGNIPSNEDEALVMLNIATPVDVMFEGEYSNVQGYYYALTGWYSKWGILKTDWYFCPILNFYPKTFDDFRNNPNTVHLGQLSHISLITPEDKAVVYPGKIHFSWKPETTATSYILSIENTNNGLKSQYMAYPSNSVDTVSRDVDMNSPGDYIWFVKYIDYKGQTNKNNMVIIQFSRFTLRHTGSLDLNPASVKYWLNGNLSTTLSWFSSSANSAVYYKDNNGPEILLLLNSGTTTCTESGGTNFVSTKFTGQVGHRYDFKLYDNVAKDFLITQKTLVCPKKWKDDLATISSGGLSVYTGSGSFHSGPFGWSTQPAYNNNNYYALSGDFNNDGLDDLLLPVPVNSWPYQVFQIALSDGDGFKILPETNYFNGSWVKAGDIDGDGYDEVMTVAGEPNPSTTGQGYWPYSNIRFYRMNGAGFTQVRELTHVYAPGYLTMGDFNGDGKADIAFNNNLNNNSVQVCLSTGSGFSDPVTWKTGLPTMSAMLAGDFDGDGKDDIAYTYNVPYGPSTLKFLKSNGAGFVDNNVTNTLMPSGKMAAGDFDRDGKTDIGFSVVSNYTTKLKGYRIILNGSAIQYMGNILELPYGTTFLCMGNFDAY